MGTNKALLRLSPDGPTFVEQVVAAVRQVSAEVWLVTNQPEQYTGLSLPTVGDNYQVGASLAGLEAGLSNSPYQYNIVVACDMPYVNSKLLQGLLDRRQNYAALIPINHTGQLETLCALYSQGCLSAIRQYLALGRYKMTDWLSEVNTGYVSAAELEECEPGLRSFLNFNTPEELARFKQS